MADPTSHPTKYKHYYANYKTVKEIVAKGHNKAGFLGLEVALLGTGLVSQLSACNTTISVLTIVANIWSWSQFTKIEKKFKAMKTNQWLKTTYTYRWRNQGKNSGYVRSATPKLEIVDKKGQ